MQANEGASAPTDIDWHQRAVHLEHELAAVYGRLHKTPKRGDWAQFYRLLEQVWQWPIEQMSYLRQTWPSKQEVDEIRQSQYQYWRIQQAPTGGGTSSATPTASEAPCPLAAGSAGHHAAEFTAGQQQQASGSQVSSDLDWLHDFDQQGLLEQHATGLGDPDAHLTALAAATQGAGGDVDDSPPKYEGAGLGPLQIAADTAASGQYDETSSRMPRAGLGEGAGTSASHIPGASFMLPLGMGHGGLEAPAVSPSGQQQQIQHHAMQQQGSGLSLAAVDVSMDAFVTMGFRASGGTTAAFSSAAGGLQEAVGAGGGSLQQAPQGAASRSRCSAAAAGSAGGGAGSLGAAAAAGLGAGAGARGGGRVGVGGGGPVDPDEARKFTACIITVRKPKRSLLYPTGTEAGPIPRLLDSERMMLRQYNDRCEEQEHAYSRTTCQNHLKSRPLLIALGYRPGTRAYQKAKDAGVVLEACKVKQPSPMVHAPASLPGTSEHAEGQSVAGTSQQAVGRSLEGPESTGDGEAQGQTESEIGTGTDTDPGTGADTDAAADPQAVPAQHAGRGAGRRSSSMGGSMLLGGSTTAHKPPRKLEEVYMDRARCVFMLPPCIPQEPEHMAPMHDTPGAPTPTGSARSKRKAGSQIRGGGKRGK